jgi:hypothetical protein
MTNWIKIEGQQVELNPGKRNFFVVGYYPWSQKWEVRSRHSTEALAIEKLRDDWEHYFPNNEARDPILNGMKLRVINLEGELFETIESKPLVEKEVA